MEAAFWVCLLLIAYPYAIYPVLLVAMNRLGGRAQPQGDPAHTPSVTVIMPVHNEASRIRAKVANLLSLDYPADRLHIVVVGDACTDDSLDVARASGGSRVEVLSLPQRAGKAAALNLGLQVARGEIVVFTDAGIILEHESLRRLVAHFSDPQVGCVSGEDYIEGAETEGLYGRIELLLRREEARLHSIAGASGCFYAQRRNICLPFISGMAPDFLSVLVTVRSGFRALAEPAARGSMKATSSQRAEFSRKVRTFLRGITALFGNAGLMNPVRYPAFGFILLSHKLLRWMAPVPMIAALALSWLLRDQPLYQGLFITQVAAYAVALAGMLWPRLAVIGVVRLGSFFLLVNLAALKALMLWARGERVEVWQPTQRPA